MKKVLVAGAGQIGSLLASLLASVADYQVYLADTKPIELTGPVVVKLDVMDSKKLIAFLQQEQIGAVISCLPYYCNLAIAELAKKQNLNYFDLTEDVTVGEAIKKLAAHYQHAYVPHCGVAPGLVNIIAASLIKKFDKLEKVELRVGNLPQNISNALQYALSWSTDGLINEYGNTCYGLIKGKKAELEPLEDLEEVIVDGAVYEAFNTSGGVGNMVELYEGKVDSLNYKTLRYPGHRDKIHFLMQDLKLNSQRDILKKILENALPRVAQDVTLINISVKGWQNKQMVEETYLKKIYPKVLLGKEWCAIQVVTAISAATAVDLVLSSDHYQGYIYQENFELMAVKNNRFGKLLEL